MSDYIKREDAIALARKGVLISNRNFKKVCKAINDLPSADVVERKRGEWIDAGQYPFDACSLCGCNVDSYEEYNYCPNCGADMRGKDK